MITPTCTGPGFRLYQQSVLDWLQWAPDESYDLILTDPPYESLEKHLPEGMMLELIRRGDTELEMAERRAQKRDKKRDKQRAVVKVSA